MPNKGPVTQNVGGDINFCKSTLFYLKNNDHYTEAIQFNEEIDPWIL